MYEVKIMSLLAFFFYRLNRHGIKYLIKPTGSGYPRILALGLCYHSSEEIVVCKVLNWKLRLLHEISHEFGLKHTGKWGTVMHPWGFLRGWPFDLSGEGFTAAKLSDIQKYYQEVLNEHSL